MMFITLTHDNQSTLSSFSLFLSVATNSPMAEKKLSGCTDLGLIVIRHGTVFQGYWTSSLWSQKDSFSFSQFLIGSVLSMRVKTTIFVVFTFMDNTDSVR